MSTRTENIWMAHVCKAFIDSGLEISQRREVIITDYNTVYGDTKWYLNNDPIYEETALALLKLGLFMDGTT